jgi:diaminopimelate decarboxylase
MDVPSFFRPSLSAQRNETVPFPAYLKIMELANSAIVGLSPEANANDTNIVLRPVEFFAHYDGPKDVTDIVGDDLTNAQKCLLDAVIEKYPKNLAPLYMVDLGDIIRQHVQWVTLLPNVRPFYAVKCNSDPVILRLLHYLGCGFDCASQSEMNMIAAITGGNYDSIVFSHPCKHPYHLAHAADVGVNLCTFDNEDEVRKIHENHPECGALLRIQVDDSQSVCKFNLKYGYNVDAEEDIHEMLRLCVQYNINLKGVMFHVGSGCMDETVYNSAIKRCKEIFSIAHQKYGYDPRHMNLIDFGGGFPGVNENDDGIQFKKIAAVINKAIQRYFSDDADEYVFIAEPGRYYVSKSHTFVCDVIAKKRKNDRFMYYLNDGLYGSFNCMYFDHFVPKLIPYSSMDCVTETEPMFKSTIFGPTCDSMDKMLDEYLIKELSICDKVIVPNFGAYTNSAASGFNGFPKGEPHYVLTL